MPLTALYTPLAVNAAWRGKSGLGSYADFVMETDAVVGQVLDALDSSQAAAETLVVFTSDNGCAPYIGVTELEQAGHFPSGPLRGYKSDVWEGGHRVPCIAWWPGQIAAGTTTDQLAMSLDIMPTALAAAHVDVPADHDMDGIDLMPLLRGKSKPQARQLFWNGKAMRDGNWKLIAGGKGGPKVGLYDLSTDLSEKKNLAEQFPERVVKMRVAIAAWQQDVDATATPQPEGGEAAPK